MVLKLQKMRRWKSTLSCATCGSAEAPLGVTPPAESLPALGLDVVNVGVLSGLDRRYDFADVHTIFDDRIADIHVLQRHLVPERDVLGARQANGAVFVENQSGQGLPGLDAFDDNDRDRILRIVQHAMNHEPYS